VIIRVLNEGQWRVEDSVRAELNGLDDAVEQAVREGDQDRLGVALQQLLDKVRLVGTPVPDEELQDSDLILPDNDSTLEDVQALLSESEEGLIPN
jgi:hypothetical protein